jgi:hypothetical protein
MRSGYARQFNLKDAFRVYLGGFLVHDLKMGIVEARNVLTDLDGWLRENGYFALTAGNGHRPVDHGDNVHLIYIFSNTAGSLGYVIHTVDDGRNTADHIASPASATLINTREDRIAAGSVAGARMVGITRLYRDFLDQIAVKN